MMTKFSRRAALALAALAPLALAMPFAAEAKTVQYSAAKYDQYIKSGKSFLLGVHADWCSTCARQKRVVQSLRKQGAPYKDLTVMIVDWDKHRNGPLIDKLNIPRRSTLIMYKKGREVGRIVAGTGTGQIKALIDKGL